VQHRGVGGGLMVANHRGGSESSMVVTTLKKTVTINAHKIHITHIILCELMTLKNITHTTVLNSQLQFILRVINFGAEIYSSSVISRVLGAVTHTHVSHSLFSIT